MTGESSVAPDAPASSASPVATRLKWPIIGLAALSGLAAVVLATAPWYRLGALSLTGRQVTGGLVPTLGWATLALTGLVLTLKRLGRVLAGVALVALGAGSIATAVGQRRPSADLLMHQGMTGAQGTITLAWVGLLVAGALTVLAGAGLAVTSRQWPERVARYQRRPVADEQSSLDAWKALDAGLDPTEDVPPEKR